MKISFKSGNLGTWLIKAIGALRNSNRVQVRHRPPSINTVPQITSAWDYRPRDANRRDAPFGTEAGAGPEGLGSTAFAANENANVWFDFTDPEATLDDPPTKGTTLGDTSGISTYD